MLESMEICVESVRSLKVTIMGTDDHVCLQTPECGQGVPRLLGAEIVELTSP